MDVGIPLTSVCGGRGMCGQDITLSRDDIADVKIRGKIGDASRRACLKIIEGLKERGAEGIILGFTELPLLIRPDDVPVPVFDTTRLHAEATVKLALSE